MTAAGGPRRVDVRGQRAEDVDVGPLVEHLRGGGLLAHPTETVYGLGSIVDPTALERLFALKGRDPERPVLLLVPSVESVAELTWSRDARELARVFWPGAVTLLLPDPDARFPPGVRGPGGAVGVRRTAHALTARLVEALGAPMTSTSANAAGEPPAGSGEEARATCAALGAGPETWVLDAGTLPPSAASTIVDCTGEVPRVRRAGATPVQRLRCLLPLVDDTRES